jgi:hypothetical protein
MKWTITEPVRAVLVDEFPKAIALLPGDTITVLYKAADQDGWDGEIICRLDDGRDVAVPRESFES